MGSAGLESWKVQTSWDKHHIQPCFMSMGPSLNVAQGCEAQVKNISLTELRR